MTNLANQWSRQLQQSLKLFILRASEVFVNCNIWGTSPCANVFVTCINNIRRCGRGFSVGVPQKLFIGSCLQINLNCPFNLQGKFLVSYYPRELLLPKSKQGCPRNMSVPQTELGSHSSAGIMITISSSVPSPCIILR